jgi:hypothetical protein
MKCSLPCAKKTFKSDYIYTVGSLMSIGKTAYFYREFAYVPWYFPVSGVSTISI